MTHIIIYHTNGREHRITCPCGYETEWLPLDISLAPFTKAHLANNQGDGDTGVILPP